MHANVEFGAHGVRLIEKPLPPRFRQFSDYRDFLQGRIAALFANARHPARHRRMRIFSTQSSGYDSTAVNALAAPFGQAHRGTLVRRAGPRDLIRMIVRVRGRVIPSDSGD